MKNRIIISVMAGLIAASLVALSGCPSGIQEVKLVYDRAPAVKDVTVTKFTVDELYYGDTTYVLVSWDAVEDGENYYVYSQEVDLKTAPSYMGGGQNSLTYSSDGTTKTNLEVDKWSFRFEVPYNLAIGKTYRIGVMTSGIFNPGTQSTSSEITWAKTTVTR